MIYLHCRLQRPRHDLVSLILFQAAEATASDRVHQSVSGGLSVVYTPPHMHVPAPLDRSTAVHILVHQAQPNHMKHIVPPIFCCAIITCLCPTTIQTTSIHSHTVRTVDASTMVQTHHWCIQPGSAHATKRVHIMYSINDTQYRCQ